ncbi:MAG: flagellar biosynthetic protein FliR [Phycisphaeraceae bacterium]|nr:flagellar biosynthetic protein FliR [Phycisphaeraceae bacterium]
MIVIDHILPHAVGFVAVLCRLGGLFIFAPALGSESIPMRLKAMIALVMTAAVYPLVSGAAMCVGDVSLPQLGWLVFTETLVGLSIGLMATLPIVGLQVGGALMGHQMGLAAAQVFNPTLDTEADTVGQLMLFVGLAVFLSIGGLEAMHLAVAHSFDRIPIGGFGADRAPLAMIVGALQSGFELAFRVGAPVFCIMLVESVGTGFLMKTVPQLNILSFGFPLKILLGVFTLIAALGAVSLAGGEEVERITRMFLQWARTA